jgi:hypothetical protein
LSLLSLVMMVEFFNVREIYIKALPQRRRVCRFLEKSKTACEVFMRLTGHFRARRRMDIAHRLTSTSKKQKPFSPQRRRGRRGKNQDFLCDLCACAANFHQVTALRAASGW